MPKFDKIKISSLIFSSICFIGCLCHVIQVTEVYLTFQTKTDVSFDSRSQIVVPMVSFCTLRVDSLKIFNKNSTKFKNI